MASEYRLRNVKDEDRETIFAWRNDPWLVSKNPGATKVDWETHVLWFSEMLDATSHLLWVIECGNGTGIGTVRLDRASDNKAVVSIYLLRPYAGKGIGVAALVSACRRAFNEWPWLELVEAQILEGNQRSIRAFKKVGFRKPFSTGEVSDGFTLMVIDRASASGG